MQKSLRKRFGASLSSFFDFFACSHSCRITGLAFSPDYKKLIVSSSHALFDFGICRVPSLVDMCTVFLVDNKEKYFADLDFDDIFPDEMLLKINFLNEKNHKKIRFLRDCDSEKEEI